MHYLAVFGNKRDDFSPLHMNSLIYLRAAMRIEFSETYRRLARFRDMAPTSASPAARSRETAARPERPPAGPVGVRPNDLSGHGRSHACYRLRRVFGVVWRWSAEAGNGHREAAGFALGRNAAVRRSRAWLARQGALPA